MITREELTIIINGSRHKYSKDFIKGKKGETPVMSCHDPEGDPLKWRDIFMEGYLQI